MLKKMLWVIWSFLLITNSAFAEVSLEHMYSDESLLLIYPITVIATIKEVDENQANTNEEPPKLIIEINQILRGEIKKGEIEAIWRPFPYNVDWSGDAAGKLKKQWGIKSNPPPEKESKWIISGNIENGIFYISPVCRYLLGEESLNWVKSVLAQENN